MPPIPLTPAKVDLVAMVREADLQTIDGVADYFVHRFLRVELTQDRRQLVLDYFAGSIGPQKIDFGDSELETKLREAVHLIMSMAEYQIA